LELKSALAKINVDFEIISLLNISVFGEIFLIKLIKKEEEDAASTQT